jgi:hypothetical protein
MKSIMTFFTFDLSFLPLIDAGKLAHLLSTSWATRHCSCLPAHPPARPFINIGGLVVKILLKITVIVSQSWLDIGFYKVQKIKLPYIHGTVHTIFKKLIFFFFFLNN